MEKNIQEIAKEIAAEIISRGNDSGREYIVYKSGLWEALYQGQQRLNMERRHRRTKSKKIAIFRIFGRV